MLLKMTYLLQDGYCKQLKNTQTQFDDSIVAQNASIFHSNYIIHYIVQICLKMQLPQVCVDFYLMHSHCYISTLRGLQFVHSLTVLHTDFLFI